MDFTLLKIRSTSFSNHDFKLHYLKKVLQRIFSVLCRLRWYICTKLSYPNCSEKNHLGLSFLNEPKTKTKIKTPFSDISSSALATEENKEPGNHQRSSISDKLLPKSPSRKSRRTEEVQCQRHWVMDDARHGARDAPHPRIVTFLRPVPPTYEHSLSTRLCSMFGSLDPTGLY